MFRKTPHNPAQCKLDDHETTITKLDNENDTGRFSEDMRRFTVCYLAQSAERPFETGWKRITWRFEIKTGIETKAKQNFHSVQWERTSWDRKACNPGLAFQVLSEEIDIGLLLPCNVVVYEDPEKGETVLGVIDPEMMLQATGRTDLDVFAKSVREKLQTALDSVWS